MMPHSNRIYQYTCLSILIIFSLVMVVNCGGISPALVQPSQSPFFNALPPATPLVCPGAHMSTGSSSFVGREGNQLVYQGHPLKLSGFTFYPTTIGGSAAWYNPNFPHYIDQMLTLGAQAGQNLVRTTDFWDQNYQENKQDDAIIWQNMDYLVCAAKQRGLFVEMDISAFGWFLLSQKQDEFQAGNWSAFLAAVGKHYSDQPTVAFYSILGEPAPPTTADQMRQLVNFYRVVTDDLRASDGNHLIMAGGFNHMEDETPQLAWWQQIYALPNNDLVGFKTYSLADLQIMPRIAAYARQIGEPMIDEEFGMPQDQGDAKATGRVYNGLQISRSQFFAAVYRTGATNGVSAFVFWNLGCAMGDTHYEVNPQTSAVWQVIQRYAPVSLAAPGTQAICPTNG
jgi:hypothetical protein